MLRRAALFGLALGLAACTDQVMLYDVVDASGPDLPPGRDLPGFPMGDAYCGDIYRHITYSPRAAQILILLDRSYSMQSSFAGSTTREAAAQSALLSAVGNYQFRVKFGFEQFPPDTSDKAYDDCQWDSCCAGSVAVGPVPMAYNAIRWPMQCGDPPGSLCPYSGYESASSSALAQAADYLKYPPSSDDRYVLLVTASEPSCSQGSDNRDPCSSAKDAATALGNLRVCIVVLSVGYSPSGKSCLTSISKTGSLLSPPPGTSTLYAPSNMKDLSGDVTELVSAVARTGCTLDSSFAPPSQASLKFYMNDNVIPQVESTDGNGWSFADPSHATIILSGSACDQYLSSQMSDLYSGYNCSTCGGPNACQ
jgi:hypothetical protein